MDAAINIIITDLTTKSAFKNKENKEKSTTADDISPDVTMLSIFICPF